MFLKKMEKFDDILTQKEIGLSSWFGFSMVIKPGSSRNREDLIQNLNKEGFECRPIVGGNFAKNEVMQYFDHSIHGELKNANCIDKRGLFVGNHHYAIDTAIEALKSFI